METRLCRLRAAELFEKLSGWKTSRRGKSRGALELEVPGNGAGSAVHGGGSAMIRWGCCVWSGGPATSWAVGQL
jgi:hypothetical protein